MLESILVEWANLEWFAPAIARRVCRYLKYITDSSPRVWANLSLPFDTLATADGVCEWLRRAKAAPKELCIETEDPSIISAALDGCRGVTSLIYRTPMFQSLPPAQQKQIRLPGHLRQLLHLRVDTSNIDAFVGQLDIFEFYQSPYGAHFPSLTTLELIFVDLTDFEIAPGLFPVVRRLALESVDGPILDLIEACSGTIEDLRVNMNFSYNWEAHPHDRISLPMLKVLIINEAVGIAPYFNAPALRLLYANLNELNGTTGPLNSVVEWASRWSPSPIQHADITKLLVDMPQLQHLMLCEPIETLIFCFEFLRDSERICPELRSIQIVELAGTFSVFGPDTTFLEFLKTCVAWRAEKVPGFTLQFGQDEAQFVEDYTIGVCLFVHLFASFLILPCL